jgi:hypothetical protein
VPEEFAGILGSSSRLLSSRSQALLARLPNPEKTDIPIADLTLYKDCFPSARGVTQTVISPLSHGPPWVDNMLHLCPWLYLALHSTGAGNPVLSLYFRY